MICPSAPAIAANNVVGIFDGRGVVRYFPVPVPVVFDFDTISASALRLSGKCVASRCRQWTGEQCGLPARIVSEIPQEFGVPRTCNIRGECRWYLQNGRDICIRCPSVSGEMAA